MTTGTRGGRPAAPPPVPSAAVSAPLFSIITPMYNAADVVVDAIRSAQRQTLGEFELIALDDGSTDETADLVRALAADDPRIRLERQENAGANATRNRAMSMARGRYITFLDSDDLKLPTYLEDVHRAFEANPSAGLAYTDAYVMDHDTGRVYRRTFIAAQGAYDPPPPEPAEFLERLLETCFIPFSATTLRRSVVEEVGAFDPRLAGTDDYELWLRIVARGHGVVRVPGTLAVMRRRPGQISGDLSVMWRNLRQAYLLVADEYDAPESVRLRARARAEQLIPAIWAAEMDAEAARRRGVLGKASRALWNLRMHVTWVRSWRARPPRDLVDAFPDIRTR